MKRYFLDIAYNGGAYHGWQIQPNAITVQEELEKCFSTLLKREVSVTGSGRTDAGVHAAQQIVHLDVEENTDVAALVYKANAFLPHDVLIKEFYEVRNDAHARFDAVERGYRYYLSEQRDPFRKGFYWYFRKPLDVATMNKAAEFLLTFEDFTSFSKLHADTPHNLCDIRSAVWQYEDGKLVFTITANRFLRGMVRAIVGTLVEVGLGKISVDDFKKIIELQDRKAAAANAPAEGLFLDKVQYPDHAFVYPPK